MEKKKEYVDISQDAICEKETWERFCKLLEEKPELIETFNDAIDKTLFGDKKDD